jgi:hypothetical protein
MMFIVEDGGVELDESGLINKDPLYEFREGLVELAHWDELIPAERRTTCRRSAPRRTGALFAFEVRGAARGGAGWGN